MLAWLAHFAAGQQVAVGMIGAALAGSLLYALKALPGRLLQLLADQFSTTLLIEATDDAYEHLQLWFSRRRFARNARQLLLAPEYDYAAGAWRWTPTLGRGWHLRWWRGRPLLIEREVQTESELTKIFGRSAKNARIRLVTPGRSRAGLDALIAEVEAMYNGDGLVRVHFWADGYYRMADKRRPRPMDTVFLPRTQKARLAADIRAFLAGRAEYERRGTPYRRGYLLEGPPGAGKTSLIFALAGLHGRDVYAINLANITSDNALMMAFNEIPPGGVAVIEDIDTAEVTRDRQLVEAELRQARASGGGVVAMTGGQQLTLSGLLNAIDGLPAREGRILFITSNAPETLDAALLRPGRIDVRERIDALGREPAWDMYAAFAERPTPAEFDRLIAPRLPLSGSALQGLLQAPAHELVELEPARRRA